MGRRISPRSNSNSKIVSALALALASALSLSLAPREAEACSCRPPPPPERALEAAEAVFEARVSSPPTKSGAGGVASTADETRVPLKVLRAWKGAGVEAGRDVTLLTPSGSASCGYGFKAGESYVIYAARTQSGDLTTNICTRTRRSQDAAEDVAALDAAVKAGGGATPPSTGTSDPGGSGAPGGSPTPGGSAAETPPGGGSTPPATGGEAGSPPPGGGVSPPGSAAPSGGGCAGCATAPAGEGAEAFLAPALALGLAAGLRRARRAQKARGAQRTAP